MVSEAEALFIVTTELIAQFEQSATRPSWEVGLMWTTAVICYTEITFCVYRYPHCPFGRMAAVATPTASYRSHLLWTKLDFGMSSAFLSP